MLAVVERRKSIEALETHLMAPHMREFRQTTGPMRAGVALQILKSA